MKEDFKTELDLVNEMKTLYNQITELRVQLIFKELDIRELQNEIKEQKQKINAIYGKEEK